MLPLTSLVFSLLALTAQVAVAAPPACLLAAVNEQSEPSNMSAVCAGSNATAVATYLCKTCGDDTKAALSEFEAACLGAGLDISTEDACSPDSQSSSGLHMSTRSGHPGHGTATATTTGSADATSSASQAADSAEGTNAAGSMGGGQGGVAAALLFAALAAL